MVRLNGLMRFRFENPKQGTPMVYPYTYSALWSQWNFRFWFRSNWYFRYLTYSLALFVVPFVFYINGKVNSPAAKAAWAAKCKQDEQKEHLAQMWKDIEGINANR